LSVAVTVTETVRSNPAIGLSVSVPPVLG